MNAPARFPAIDHGEPASFATIRAFCSPRDEMELAVRADLATLRDQASVGLSRGTDGAAAVLAEVCRVATAHVYAPVPTSRLIRVLATLRFLMDGARHLDRLERDG